MYSMRELATVVRELRDRDGLTQHALAAKARVSRSFIADVEAGKPTVEADRLFHVLQALGFEIALRAEGSGEVRW